VARIENVYSFHDNNPKQVKNKIGEHLGFIKLPLDRQLKDAGLVPKDSNLSFDDQSVYRTPIK